MMRYIKHHMATIDGVEIWPLLSLGIFFLFFVLLIWRVIRMRRGYVEEMGNMPLAVILLVALGAPNALLAQGAQTEVVEGAAGVAQHFGMSDNLWVIALLSSTVILTWIIVMSLRILRELIVLKLSILSESGGLSSDTTPQKSSLSVMAVFALALSPGSFWLLVMANVFLVVYLVVILRNIKQMSRNMMQTDMELEAIEAAEASCEIPEETGPNWLERLWKGLNAHVEIEHEEDVMLDHAYDGIRELDNRLPPWWLYGFYVSMFFSVAYIFNYHFFKYAPLQAQEYELAMQDAEAEVDAYLSGLAANVDERTVQYILDAGRLSDGKSIYKANCVACHAPDGGGGVGPNFTDSYWISGGHIGDLFRTIKYGVPAKGMRPWKADLTAVQIQNVATYILSLQGTEPAAPKDAQGDYVEPELPLEN